jgi:hypothetical protein
MVMYPAHRYKRSVNDVACVLPEERCSALPGPLRTANRSNTLPLAAVRRTINSVARIGRTARSLSVILVAALAGCADEGGRLSIEETLTCASEQFKDNPGTFALVGNTIAYAYESETGLGKVIVTFDEKRRPVSTYFESAPYGSHEMLMDAARAIKDCAEYGRKTAKNERRRSAPQMIGV